MHFPPPDVVASWPPPNHVNPEQRGPVLLIVELTILPLAILSLLLRLYVRVRVVHSAGSDDWIMVLATVCGIGVSLCSILATQLFRWNLHVWDVYPGEIVEGRKAQLASQTLFAAATSLAKASILLSYLRIAPHKSWFRRATWAALGLVSVVGSAAVAAVWLQCSPINAYWNMQDPTAAASCAVDEGPLMLVLALANVSTDVLVYVLPIPTLAALALPLGQRVATIGLFSLGLVVVLAGCMRAYLIWAVVVAEANDFTWDSYRLWIWTAVECQLSVICGCVPVLKPLFFMAVGRWDDVEADRRARFAGDGDDFDFCDTVRSSTAYTQYTRSIYSSHTVAPSTHHAKTSCANSVRTNRFSVVWGNQDAFAHTNVIVETSPADVTDPWYPGTRPSLIPPPRPPRPDSYNAFEFAELDRRYNPPEMANDPYSRSWSPTGVTTVITAGSPARGKARSLRWA